jgi:hypothetical protein
MPIISDDKFGRIYHAVNCQHCSAPILFDDDPDTLPDPFQTKCLECGGLGTYQRRQVRLVQVQRGN